MERIIEFARAYRAEAGLTHRQLAYRVGFRSDNALVRMDDEDWNPTRKTLQALREFLGDWKPGMPTERETA